MDTHMIAPTVQRISLDRELSSQYAGLNNRLDWQPLATNLESSEELPYLYFRVTLNLSADGTTYAGFSTGAPFWLRRDHDFLERGFFLRHWIRKSTPNEGQGTPFTTLQHMAIGLHENQLVVRVEIERPFDTRDMFKSVFFDTWMFQIVQIDAIIDELPNVRFAFAVERTVTSEDGDVITSLDKLELTERKSENMASSDSE